MPDPLFDVLQRLAPAVDTDAGLAYVHHTAALVRRRQRVLVASAAVLALVLILSGAGFAASNDNSVGIDTIDDDTRRPATTVADLDTSDSTLPGPPDTTLPGRPADPPQTAEPRLPTDVTLPFTPTGTTIAPPVGPTAPRPSARVPLAAGPALPPRRPTSTGPGSGPTATSTAPTTSTTSINPTTPTTPTPTTTTTVPVPAPPRVSYRIDQDSFGSVLLGRSITFHFSVKNAGVQPVFFPNPCPGAFDFGLADPPPPRTSADLWLIDLPRLHELVDAGGTANHGWDPVRRQGTTQPCGTGFIELGPQQFYEETFIWEALTAPGQQPDISNGALVPIGFHAAATFYSAADTSAPSVVVDRVVSINVKEPSNQAVSDGVELYPVDRAVAAVEQSAIVANWLSGRTSCFVRIVFRIDRWEVWFEDPAGPRLRVLVDAAEAISDIRSLGSTGGPSDDPELEPDPDEVVLYPPP